MKHSNPIEYRIYMEQRYSAKMIDMLIQQRNEVKRFTVWELMQKIDEYEWKLAILDRE